MFLHKTLKFVSDANVLQITGLAHKYQVETLVLKCKRALNIWIDDCYNLAGVEYNLSQLKYLLNCLNILKLAVLYGLTEISTKCQNTISKFPAKFYVITQENFVEFAQKKWREGINGHNASFNKDGEYDEYFKQQADCFKRYKSLPHDVQQFIIIQRLNMFDDNKRK